MTPDHIWYLLATGTPSGTHGSALINKNTWKK